VNISNVTDRVRELRPKRNREMNTSEMRTERNVLAKGSAVSENGSTSGNTMETRLMGVSESSMETGLGTQMSQKPHQSHVV
jgi:hypothetical protein